MKIKRLSTGPLALLIGISAAAATVVPLAPAAGATTRTATTMKEMSKAGVFAKFLSKKSFRMTSGMHSYVVKLDAMAHVTFDGKMATLAQIKKGDHVKVTGEVEMGDIVATKVVASGM
jgi:hypothetical protein